MQYVIYAGSTTDGKVYKQVICDCGLQATAGTCSHVKNSVIVEESPYRRPDTTQPPWQQGNEDWL